MIAQEITSIALFVVAKFENVSKQYLKELFPLFLFTFSLS